MAYAGPITQQGDPELTYRDPNAYIAWLRSKGVPPQQVYQMVTDRFGPPKTREQQQKEQASSSQTAAFAQTGGALAGIIGARYIYNNAGTLIDKLTGKEAPPEVINAVKTGQTPPPTATTTGTTTTPATTSVPQTALTGNNVIPQGSAVPQGYTAVGTSADGGTIVAPTKYVNSLPTDDPGFLSSVNWDAVGTGALSALAAYQAYKSYKEGDYAGAGLSGATAVSLGASAAGQAGLQFTGQQTLAGAAPYLGVAAGAYQGYKTAEMIGDTAAGSQRTKQGALGGATSGALMGSYFGPWGTVIGGAVGGLAGAVGSWTGSHKGKAQFTRDNIRGVLQKGGVLDQNFQGTLADGSTYDFGADGSTLKWKNIDKVAEAQPSAWSGAVPLTDAMATAYGFVGQKASDISAWYAKAAVSNANNDPNVAKANARHFAAQQGITYDMIKSKLDQAKADNRINDSQYNYYMQGAQDLVGSAPAATRQVAPPAKGQVARVSPGMYMNDKGKVVASKDVRSALKKYYGEGKTNAKK